MMSGSWEPAAGFDPAPAPCYTISRPQSTALGWSVTSLLRLQDRRIADPARAVTGSLRSTDTMHREIRPVVDPAEGAYLLQGGRYEKEMVSSRRQPIVIAAATMEVEQ